MKILITGAAGLIGSHLCDNLLQEGHTVIGIDNLSYGNISNLHKDVTLINDDVQHLHHYTDQKFDIIYHLASLKKVWDGSISSYNVMDVNFNMTKQVIEKATTDNSKLIFTSTSDIYGNSKTFSEDSHITMGPPTNIRYSYALSKWHSEQLILNTMQESQLDCVIARIFGCASSRSNKSWSGGHIPLFVSLALQNKDIIIHGDGLQTRSISHAKDIAKGLCDMKSIQGEIINLGTDEQTTVKSVAEYIINKVGSQSKIKYITSKEVFGDYTEINKRFANTTKAKLLIDYKVQYTTKQVIDEIIKQFKYDKY